MISDESPLNNRGRLFLTAGLILLTGMLLLWAGCGNGESSSSAENEQSTDCQVTIDDSAWQLLVDLKRRQDEGQTLTREDFAVYSELPIIEPWLESMSARVPIIRIINWLESSFAPQDSRNAQKPSKDRAQFSKSYKYSLAHQEEIDTLIADFRDQGRGCSMLDQAEFWLTKTDLPESLTVVFIPSKPEIRTWQDMIFVDTGVLQAGSPEQLERQLAGLLFRTRKSIPGPQPSAEDGKAAVAHSIRVMMNEGILGYIEDQPSTRFKDEHYKLGEINIVPEFVYEHGVRAISLINLHMPTMTENEEVMMEKGRNMAKTLIASSSLQQGGYCMSATIAAQLGDERLQQTIGSPALWLQAYQEAAKLNPVPQPAPYDVMDAMHTSMPPFDDRVFIDLVRICEEAFSQ